MATIYGEQWETIRTLGEGGQAHTFLVQDITGSDKVQYILKRLKNINRIERFKREVEVVRSFNHPNIVSLKDFNLEAQKPYMVFEYCSGGELTQAKHLWEDNPVKALRIFYEICEGIAYAHKNNIYHRDIKPQNIFLRTSNGPPVIGDFGICYVDDDGSRLTITEEAVGPRLYMAPELEDGRLDDISNKSDVYSLGKLLYWMISGKVFSREQHRKKEWDLKGYNEDTLLGWNNIYMEHVNKLLDIMIKQDPNERRSVPSILILLKKTIRLVEKEFTPIAKDLKQPCAYCGLGFYVLKATDNYSAQYFGLTMMGKPIWRIFVCNTCGHMQYFRLEDLEKGNIWE